MSEWIDVPVAEVAKGDEIKVRGTGRVVHQVISYYYAAAERWRAVTQVDDMIVWFGPVHIDRLNITAVRRRTPEPSPKPGDWRHGAPCSNAGLLMGHIDLGERESCSCPQVFRASGGWSRDTRTGQPWVVRGGDPIVVHVEAESQNACDALRKAAELAYRGSYASPNQLDDYKRIGLDVRPVDRRGKR